VIRLLHLTFLIEASELDGPGEHGNEPSGSIKGGEFFDQLNDCQLLKKDSAAWSLLIDI
jgi:hypothetical protein